MKFLQKKAYLLVFASGIFSTCVLADRGVITEDDLFAEIDYVSGVTHLKQDLQQVPAAVTIIDRRTIESSTAVDLVDLFRLVPGFQVYFFHGNKPGVTYHVHGGQYSRRLEVKIDGRSVYEPLLSSVEWNTLGVELDDIEYIEVVRGSNSAADGSNAFIASVNIVTRSPLADLGAKVSMRMGSGGINSQGISHSMQLGQLATRTSLRASKNDGFKGVDDSADTVTFSYQGLWTPTVTDTINFQIGLGDTETTVKHEDDDEKISPRRDWINKYQNFNWKRVTNDWSDIEFSLYHNAIDFVDDDADWSVEYVLEEAKKYPPYLYLQNTRELLNAEENKDKVKIIEPNYAHNSDRWDADLRANIYHLDDFRLNLGAAIRHDSFDTELFLSGPGSVSQVSNRLYTNMEWTASNQLTLNFGHALEKRRSKRSANAFRLAANYQFSEEHLFRIASSKSYREPTLLEANQSSEYKYNDEIIHIRAEADPDISKEELISYEIGYLGSFLDRTIHLDVRLFDEDMSGLIDERLSLYNETLTLSELRNTDHFKDTGTYEAVLENFGETQRYKNVYDNVEDMRLKGIEWQLQYKPSNKALFNINHSYIDVSGLGGYGIIFEDELLLFKENFKVLDKAVPNEMLNVLASFMFDNGVRLSGSYHYKSDYKSNNRRDIKVPSYSRIDLKASKKWRLANNWIELSLTAQNTGDDYIEYFSYNKFESKYILELKMGSN
jgi:iron complex outermembrane receptor protein